MSSSPRCVLAHALLKVTPHSLAEPLNLPAPLLCVAHPRGRWWSAVTRRSGALVLSRQQ